MLASALDKVITFACEVLFKRNRPTLTKPEATPGERIDLRISGRPKVPRTTDEKAEKAFLISGLTQQDLYYPNKSTMIADLINNYAQTKTEHVEYYPVSRHDSEIHAEQNGNMERHEVSKIEDRGAMPMVPRILWTKRNISRLWSYVTGHHRRGQEAGRVTNQQSIHHVRPWHS